LINTKYKTKLKKYKFNFENISIFKEIYKQTATSNYKQIMASLFGLFASSDKDAPSPSKDNNNNNEDKKLNANLPGGKKRKSPDNIIALQLLGQSELINIDCKANALLNIASSIQASEETGKEDERLPIEIAIALDVSGSMSGEKIKLCKDTLELISKYLLPKDKISITTFDTQVKRVFELQPMNSTNKQRLEQTIKKVKAGSSTNLSGGLADAISILKESNSGKSVKACILLTDGHANHGIQNMDKLAAIIKNELAGTSISLFTYGYGANHNVNGLQKLAQQSDGGAYYFVDKEDNISSAIGDCLGGIMSVVAQNIVLEAKPAVSGVTICNCFEESREVNISKDGVYTIKFGDIYAGERRDTVFAINVDPARAPETNVPLVTFKIKYLDALNECLQQSEVTCTINRVEDDEVDTNLTNKNISTQVVRVVIAKALSESNNLADKRKFKEAKEILSQALKFAAENKNKVDDVNALNSLISDINDTMKAMENNAVWSGSAGYYAKSKAMQHRIQRCTEEHEDTYSSYRTSRKVGMAKSMKRAAKSKAKNGFW
jgi:Mg-chelatase subunit ChlD